MKSWKEIPIGGRIVKKGSSLDYKTGSWKSLKPILDTKKCINCMRCVVFCPDDCIPLKDGKRLETDLDYCKGCLICLEVCPVKALSAKKESEK
ncbi:MAG: 4Fe-4S binding protein [Nanoarchaeota archaeon]|nr:4Fe-4S binding protein [Nanoarchaeota archaeon]